MSLHALVSLLVVFRPVEALRSNTGHVATPMRLDSHFLEDNAVLHSSNISMAPARLDVSPLRKRQTLTCDPGLYLCHDFCCYSSEDCFPEGCCDSGNVPCPGTDFCCPSGTCAGDRCCYQGTVPCGNINTGGTCIDEGDTCCGGAYNYGGCDPGFECCGSDGCYNPRSNDYYAVCCKDISETCKKGYTCCGYACCPPGQICGAGEECVDDPSATCTTTVTQKSTRYSTDLRRYTVYTTEPEEPESFEPTCPETSFVNSESTTILLDSECLLTVVPPTSTQAQLAPTAALARRQNSCLYTVTTTAVLYTTVPRIAYTTVTAEATEDEPLCFPLTVSNCYGDTLELDSECSFQFEKGTETCSSSAGATTTAPTQLSGGEATQPGAAAPSSSQSGAARAYLTAQDGWVSTILATLITLFWVR